MWSLMPSKWNAPLKPWARKSPQTSASTANRSTGFRCPRRSTWVSMERGSLCELRNSGACLVKGMVPRKLGKSNSAPSGVRNRSIAMATRSAIGIGQLFGSHRKCFRSEHRQTTFCLCSTCLARSPAAPFHPGRAYRGTRRWCPLDLESGRGTISWHHRDR